MQIRPRVFAISFLVFILAAALNDASSQTRKPETRTRPTIVIVHGAWGGSWAWRQVELLLRCGSATPMRGKSYDLPKTTLKI